LEGPVPEGIICPITWEDLFDTKTKKVKDDVVAIFEEEFHIDRGGTTVMDSCQQQSAGHYTFATTSLDRLGSNIMTVMNAGRRFFNRITGILDDDDEDDEMRLKNEETQQYDDEVFVSQNGQTANIEPNSSSTTIVLRENSLQNGIPFQIPQISRSRTDVEVKIYLDSSSHARRKWIITPSRDVINNNHHLRCKSQCYPFKIQSSDEDDEDDDSDDYDDNKDEYNNNKKKSPSTIMSGLPPPFLPPTAEKKKK